MALWAPEDHEFDFHADPDPAFRSIADPDPAFQNNGAIGTNEPKTSKKNIEKNIRRICVPVGQSTYPPSCGYGPGQCPRSPCLKNKTNYHKFWAVIRCFLTPGSGIRKRFFPDPRSRIPNPYFWELSDSFSSKKFYNSMKSGPLQHFKNKIIFNYVKFVATKQGMTTIFTPLFCCCFWIRDPRWVKIRIRDKHPGSATLVLGSGNRWIRLFLDL